MGILAVIGKNIARHRKRLGHTQSELGAALGIKGSMVSYIEKGQRKLGVDKFLEIADLLHVGPLELLKEVDGGEDNGLPTGSVGSELPDYARDIDTARKMCEGDEALRPFLKLVLLSESLLGTAARLGEENDELRLRLDRMAALLQKFAK